jgi:hypothetical protein
MKVTTCSAGTIMKGMSRLNSILRASFLVLFFIGALGVLPATRFALAQDDPNQSLCGGNDPVCKFSRCAMGCPKQITGCASNLKWVKCMAECACQAWGKECDSGNDIQCPQQQSNLRSGGGRGQTGQPDRAILAVILRRPFSAMALWIQITELLKDLNVCTSATAPNVCKVLCPVSTNSTPQTPSKVLYRNLAQAIGIQCPAGTGSGGGGPLPPM